MVTMQDMGSRIAANFAGAGQQFVFWLGVAIYSAIGLAILWFVWYFFQHRYVVQIFIRGGEGHKTDEHSIRLIKNVRARQIKRKGTEKLNFFLSKVFIDPIPHKYIYPGNRIFLYQTGLEEFIPVKFVCNNPEAYFNPLPFSVRRWQNLEMQESFRNYQDQSFMAKHGGLVTFLITMLVCLSFTGLVFYWAYDMVGGGLGEVASATNSAANALKDWGSQTFGGGG